MPKQVYIYGDSLLKATMPDIPAARCFLPYIPWPGHDGVPSPPRRKPQLRRSAAPELGLFALICALLGAALAQDAGGALLSELLAV